MKLNHISNIYFQSKIIDSHAHFGMWQGKDYILDELDSFTKSSFSVNGEVDTIEKMLVSNLSGIDQNSGLTEIKANKETLNAIRRNPKLSGLAVCQPNNTNGEISSIRAILEEGKDSFVGLKFHPQGLPLRVDEAKNGVYGKYLALAEEKKLPCLFHSQVAENWSNGVETLVQEPKNWANSDPRLIYNLAKKYPTVPVILGHTGMGGPKAHEIAIKTLVESIDNNDAKLYCDISWMDWKNGLPDKDKKCLKKLIDALKKRNATDRILFGTDVPLGCYGEQAADGVSAKQAYEKTLASLKTAIKDRYGEEADNIIDKIFYKNANELFFEKNWANDIKTEPTIKKLSKTKIGLTIGAGILAFTGIAFLILNKKKKVINTTNHNINPISKPTYSLHNIQLPPDFAKFAKD